MTLICIHTYLGLRKKKYSKQKEVKENNTRVCRRPLSIFLPREFLLIPVVKQTDSNHTLTFPTITAWRPCSRGAHQQFTRLAGSPRPIQSNKGWHNRAGYRSRTVESSSYHLSARGRLSISGISLFWCSINAIIHFLSTAPNSASATPSSFVLLMKQKGFAASLLLYITYFSLPSTLPSPNIPLGLIVGSSALFK